MIKHTVTLTLLALAIAVPAAAQQESQHQLYQRALAAERSNGDIESAITLYRRAANGPDRALAARALLRIGEGYLRLGRSEAASAFQRVVRDYPDHPDAVREAREQLAVLEGAAPTSQVAGDGLLAVRLLWEGEEPTTDIEGGPTPDGRAFTYVDWTTGDLAIRDVTTGTSRLLTNTGYPEFALGSRVSHDGRRVAYFWTPDPWQAQLRIVPIDGGTPETVYVDETRTVEFMLPVGWTPDDRRVLAKFYYDDGRAELAFVDVRTRERQVVRRFDDSRRPMLAALSPDGRWIAFDLQPRPAAAERDIHVLAADGSSESVIVSSPANDLHAVFAPDGDHLLFSSDRGGSIDLWAVPFANGGATDRPFLLKRDMAENFFWPMGFTPSGSYYYAKDTGGGDIFHVALGPDGTAASAPAQLQHSAGYNLSPHLSRDGRYLAYLTMRDAFTVGHTATPVIRDLQTGAERVLDEVGAARKNSQLRWSPDGRHLLIHQAFMRRQSERMGNGIVLIDAATGEPRAFRMHEEGVSRVGNAHWTPDGKIVYPRFRMPDGPWDYIVADVETGSERIIYSGRGAPWRLSPDGRQLAVVRNTGGDTWELALVPTDGGDARRLTTFNGDHRPPGNVGLEWTPDGRHLIYGLVDTEEGWWASGVPVSLHRIDVSDGSTSELGIRATGLRSITLSADGRTLYYAAGPLVYNEVWRMDGLQDRLAGQ